MADTVRYCVQCGRAIGSALHCDGPDCNGLPNFYRDVSGPDPRSRRGRRRRDGGPPTEGPQQPARGARSTVGVDEASRGDDRHTVLLGTDPVAVLRSTAEPKTEHLLFPGRTTVGARRPAQIIIDRAEISGRHASIECRQANGRWHVFVKDESSLNGTFINDERIDTQEIHADDAVRFASAEFRLQFLSIDPPRATMQM